MFHPEYQLTNKVVDLLTTIAEGRAVIQRARLLPKQEFKLRRQALVRMTHSSTAIEGNRLNVREVEALVNNQKVDAPARDVYEVENYLKALKYIEQVIKEKKIVTKNVILKIHRLVTTKTLSTESSGRYRKNMVYVVRRHAGGKQEVMYTAPAATQVPGLMDDLIHWVQRSASQEINPVIVAGIVHQEIAAIHPFADGNGRTVRALATLVLYQRGYDFRRLFALEDYYNNDRPAYYAAINIGKDYVTRRKDFTPWLEYFVNGFKEEIDQVRHQVVSLSFKKIDTDINSQVFLDKDQVAILDFLESLGRITVGDVVDIVHCPKRTAQLQLKKLKQLKLIVAKGKARATYYIRKQ
ncbi:MAG: Fic family protein [Candidatus Kerfeldbacteria bacterium]|nr:Fic family protein [Candidatus Kerfeldbacteria bacterium]